jgi:glycosyltransferase involved in cell wall biosynthesis
MNASPNDRALAIVVPAFNEALSIQSVVRAFLPIGAVVVVDDGSADDTARLASEAGALVVRQPLNRGYTEAIAAGLKFAIDEGFTYAVTADADGQHGAGYVATAASLLKGGAEAVVGIRDRHQRYSETAFSLVGRHLWALKDPLCGIKGYRLEKLATLPKLSTYDSIATELIIRAAREGWRIEQFPVRTADRVGTSTFGRGLRAEYRIFKALWLSLLRG